MSTVSAAKPRVSSEERTARPVLLFFYSPRSGRCRRVDGFLAQVLQRRRNHDRFTICRVDCDRRPELAERFGVHRLPTLIVVEDRALRARVEDPEGCAQLARFLSPWLR